jgi:16S rRNA (guanine527-N7)-methyltransferase
MSYTLTIAGKELNLPAEKLGLSLSDGQLGQLGQFCSYLAKFNEHTNLVANSEAHVLVQDHLLDSLSLLPIINKRRVEPEGLPLSLIDIGSGGGFPGLVLAIAQPSLKVLLVESISKKARFLSEAIASLSLDRRVKVANDRAELLAHEHQYRHQFDFATARAVGATAIVLELTLPFVKLGGLSLIQKSAAQCKQEAAGARKAAIELKSRLVRVLYLDEKLLGKERGLLVFEQLGKTPRAYPRNWTELKKRPLF